MQVSMNVAEMKERFPSEWLLIVDPETDEFLKVQRGNVIFHSKNRDEVYREAVRLHPRRFATLYTGRIPHDAAVIL